MEDIYHLSEGRDKNRLYLMVPMVRDEDMDKASKVMNKILEEAKEY